MFEKSVDFFLNFSETPIEESIIISNFSVIDRKNFEKVQKDKISLEFFKEKLILFESSLQKDSKNYTSSLFFLKVFTLYLQSNEGSLMLQSDLLFPKNSLLCILKNITKYKEIIVLSEEFQELIYQLSNLIEERKLYGNCTQAFYHILEILYPETIENAVENPKYLINLLIYFYCKTEDNERLIVLEELIKKAEKNENLNKLKIDIDDGVIIDGFSYFFLKVYQYEYHLNFQIKYEKKELEDQKQLILRKIRNLLMIFFKKTKENLKNKLNLSRFLKYFLSDILIIYASQEIQTIEYFINNYGLLISEYLMLSTNENAFKLLLLDLLKGLLGFLLLNESNYEKNLNFIKENTMKSDLKPSTSTYSMNNTNDNNLKCLKCKQYINDVLIINEICIYCLLVLPKNKKNKPVISFEKMLETPNNPIFISLLLKNLLFKIESNQKYNSSYAFLSLKNISNSYDNISSIPLNSFMIEYIQELNLKSIELIKLIETFKSSLIIYSNENISLRSKVIDILGYIMNLNIDINFDNRFVEIIKNRILDTSSIVRLSTINIVLKYLEKKFDWFWFEIIGERLNDIDILIRKKIIFFIQINLEKIKNLNFKFLLKILVFKTYDTEEIKEIALKLIEQILFGKIVKKKRVKIQLDLKIIKEVSEELNSQHWFHKLLESTIRNESKITPNEIISQIIEYLTKEPNFIYLDFLLAFAKYYPKELELEILFINKFFQIIYDSQILDRRLNLLLILEIYENIIKTITSSKIISNIESLLIKLIHEENLEILHLSLKVLIDLVKLQTQNFNLIKKLYIQMYAYIIKKKSSFSIENSIEAQNLIRSLYITTYLTRYFQISEFLDEEDEILDEEIIIKTIYSELKIFLTIKNSEIQQTCIECMMILWEKMPNLVFETTSLLELYLLDPTKEFIIERIYTFFKNLLQKQDLKIKENNQINREVKKTNTRIKNSKSPIKKSPNAPLSDDFDKISGVIRDITRKTFEKHIYSAGQSVKKALIHLLEVLVDHWYMAFQEISEAFFALLCDENEEIREIINFYLEKQFKINGNTLVIELKKGLFRGLELIKKQRDSCYSFFWGINENYECFYENIKTLMSKNHEKNTFGSVLLKGLEDNSISQDSNKQKEYSIFICSIFLSLKNIDLNEYIIIIQNIYDYIARNYYKILKELKLLCLDNSFNKLIINKGLICLYLLIIINLLIVVNPYLSSNNFTLNEYIEKLKKKESKLNNNEIIDNNNNNKWKIDISIIEYFKDFMEIYNNLDHFETDSLQIKILYMKLKCFIKFELTSDFALIFAFDMDIKQLYLNKGLIKNSKNKEQTKRKAKKISKTVLSNKDSQKFKGKKPLVKEIRSEQTSNKYALRKRESKNYIDDNE